MTDGAGEASASVAAQKIDLYSRLQGGADPCPPTPATATPASSGSARCPSTGRRSDSSSSRRQNDETLSESEDPLRSIAYVDIGSVDSTIGITEMEEMVFEDAPSRARRLVRDGDTIVDPPSGLTCVMRSQASVGTTAG